MRNSGTRLHEGIDIRALQRDANGESTDPVFAARDGSVVYINTNTSASNYGKYVVLQHKANGLAIYTLYAHLSDVVDGLALGQNLKTGDRVGTLGRTSNTSDGISKARAHLHFEIGLQIHTQFESWFQHWYKDGKNHHDAWNGINLLGLDSAEILREDSRTNFDLLHYIKQQPALCRVQIHQANLEWADRFPELIVHEPNAEPLPLQAWEVHLNFNAIPIRLKPLFDEDLKKKSGGARYVLLEVDEEVRRKHPCRSLVFKRGARWAFTSKGVRALDLLTWQPPD